MRIEIDTLPGWRGTLARHIESRSTQAVLITLILINAVILGLETSEAIMARWGSVLVASDRAILAVFVVEIGLKLAIWRGGFFRDPWSVFDFIVVSIALIPAAGPLAVLRALRVLRVLRLISMVPSMRRVAGGLLAAIPGLGSVVGIIASSRTISGFSPTGVLRINLSASSPSPVVITSCPAISRRRTSSSRIADESSAIRTRLTGRPERSSSGPSSGHRAATRRSWCLRRGRSAP